MPWGEYKEAATSMLPKGTGLYVLARVLTLRRESGESAATWSQRLHKGRQRVSKRMGTNLSDACYRELLFEQLTSKEKSELVKAQTQRTPVRMHQVGEHVMANWDG